MPNLRRAVGIYWHIWSHQTKADTGEVVVVVVVVVEGQGGILP